MTGGRRRTDRSAGFGLRLAATVVLTLAALGVAQYALAGRALTERVLVQELNGHRADAQVLVALHRPDAADPMSEVGSLLGHMASRPTLTSVVLLGPDGRPLLRGGGHDRSATAAGGHGGSTDASGAMPMPAPAQMPMPMPMPEAPSAATGTAATAGLDGLPAREQTLADRVRGDGVPDAERLRDAGRVVHAVPVELTSGRHVLLVTRSDTALESQVSSVRRVLLTTLTLGALLFLPLFYLVGGRGLALRHRRAVTASTRDHLTGLGNHGAFSERLATAVARGTRSGSALCLALFDLDGFKEVNDLRGHRHGDEVLGAVAAVLGRHGAEQAHRVGGDEFALLVPLTLDRAHDVCEQVRREISDLQIGVTTSVGVAALAPGGTATGLRDAADSALYAAKNSGGDRVVSALAHLEPVDI